MVSDWTSGPAVAEVGEQGVLDRILPLLPRGTGMAVGPGDDSAVVNWASPTVVTSCDLLIEGPDFVREWSSGYDVGWKAMASNLADIAAMGAIPRGVIIGVAVPRDVAVSALEDLSRGVAEALAEMAPGCGVWGGDVSTSAEVVVSVTVVGDLLGQPPVLRSGARPGDVLVLAGSLGESARGLELLRSAGSSTREIARLRSSSPQVIAHLRPRPPIAWGVVARQAGATAMMDVSDGLLLDATRMARASGVSIDLDPERIPDQHALTGGEDHGLLACFPPGVSLPDGCVRIGLVGPAVNGVAQVTLGGKVPQVVSPGWDPYRAS